MKYTKESARKRLKELRSENRQRAAAAKQNAVESLFEEIVQLPEMKYTGGDRSDANRIVLPNGREKYPDFRFNSDPSKVIEVIGTYSHGPGYSSRLAKAFKRTGIDAFVVNETDIVNKPERVRNEVVNFYGRCPKCGQHLHSLGTESPICPHCGAI